jgi:hypothetical protein
VFRSATVETHLRHAFRKLGSTARADLPARCFYVVASQAAAALAAALEPVAGRDTTRTPKTIR